MTEARKSKPHATEGHLTERVRKIVHRAEAKVNELRLDHSQEIEEVSASFQSRKDEELVEASRDILKTGWADERPTQMALLVKLSENRYPNLFGVKLGAFGLQPANSFVGDVAQDLITTNLVTCCGRHGSEIELTELGKTLASDFAHFEHMKRKHGLATIKEEMLQGENKRRLRK